MEDLVHEYSRNPFGRHSVSNLFFDNGTIYSFGLHFPIAVTLSDGNTVLMTSRDYSSSTSRHTNLVKSAVSHKELIFVSDPLGVPKDNARVAAQSVEESLMKAVKSKKASTRAGYLEEAVRTVNNLEKYFNAIKKKDRIFLEPCKKAKSTLRMLKKLISSENLLEVFGEKFAEKREADKKAYDREKARRLAREKVEQKLRIEEWKKGEIRGGLGELAGDRSYLRVFKDSGIIETTKGYKISIAVVRKLYDMRVKGNLLGADVEGFPVVESTPDHIKIGCHTIDSSEILWLAQELGWTVSSESAA